MPQATPTIIVNREYLIYQMARRAMSIEETAHRAGITRETLSKALAGYAIEVATARRIALVFQERKPTLDTMREPDGVSLHFPIVITPMDRRGLQPDEPVLQAEHDWYELPEVARARWPRRAAQIRYGMGRRGFMGGRDWGLSDIQEFIPGAQKRCTGAGADG